MVLNPAQTVRRRRAVRTLEATRLVVAGRVVHETDAMYQVRYLQQ
jgi:hypothetical protein